MFYQGSADCYLLPSCSIRQIATAAAGELPLPTAGLSLVSLLLLLLDFCRSCLTAGGLRAPDRVSPVQEGAENVPDLLLVGVGRDGAWCDLAGREMSDESLQLRETGVVGVTNPVVAAALHKV